MKISKASLTAVGSVILLAIFFYAGSEVMQSPPDNLKVMIDNEKNTYISPECLRSNIDYENGNYEVATFSYAANELNYKSDSTCTDNSLWPSRNQLWNAVGTKLGILEPLDWKWDDEGNWKEDAF